MQALFSGPAHSNSPRHLPIASLIFTALLAALLALLCLISPAHGQGRISFPLILSAIAEQSVQQPLDVPDDLVTPAQVGKLLLPLVSAGNMELATEVFPVGYSLESSISALGGRLTIQIPQQAVSMNNCTLTVVSPNPQAAWLEAYIYILCDYSPTLPPKWITELYKPLTISLDYSRVDLTYLDETRFTVRATPSYDWVPELDGWKPVPEMASIEAASSWETHVDVAAKRVILSTDRLFIVPRIAVGYSISDMTIGPSSTVYAAAAPVIYSVGNAGTLTRLVNLDELAGAADLHTDFARFAVNTTNGEIYVALRGKEVGAALKVYAIKGGQLRALYTVPAEEELWVMAYRPQDNALYLGMAKITDYWFGCALRDNWIRAINADSGTILGSVNPYLITSGAAASINPLAALVVDSTGHLLATQSTEGCEPSGYISTHLLTGTAPDLIPGFHVYPYFRNANYIAGDSQGRTYISNGDGNAISVVAGAPSEVVGYLTVDRPGPLAISGSTLYVVSNDRIIKRSTSDIVSAGNEVEIATRTLHRAPSPIVSADASIRVTAQAFSPIMAHNTLYYNGARFFPAEIGSSFTGQETELTFPITVAQPDPVRYKPLIDQRATVTFRMNGVEVAAVTIDAPEAPYQRVVEPQQGANINVVPYQWMLLTFTGSLSSQEGLFPDIPATLTQGTQSVFIQFKEPGVYHFTVKIDYPMQDDKVTTFTATVGAYGDYDTRVKTIDPATGGVLWVGGAAFEIAAGALPELQEGYQVTFTSQSNELVLKDAVSERSPIYTFSFEPEVLHLNQELYLHLPRVGDEQIMAFYDPLIDDAYTIPATPEAPMHLLVTLPAGDYASEATDSSTVVSQAVQPQVTESDWMPYPYRQALNWLGRTGLWHAYGLPNDKLVTEHFVILYNTNDCTPTYAGVLLDALEDAYIHFSAQGAHMPATSVYVKIAPWITSKSIPGLTPGIGSLFHYYMFINNSLSTEALQDTAVHEFMHVLQKTNASPDGRYVNPLWWEEATAIWAQYSFYPEHTTYLNDFQGDGERWLHNPYSIWNSMSTAEMYAAMSLAEYLVQNYGKSAVFSTFQHLGIELGNEVDIAEAIEKVTQEDFGDFYERFAQDYWLQKFEPVKSWTFIETYTGTDAPKNAILRIGINQPVNYVHNAYIQDLSSALYKIYSIDPLPVSFTRDTGSTTGSMVRVSNSCTGNLFYFYDANRTAISNLYFAGQPLPGHDEILYDKNLGNLTLGKPLYMLSVDRAYNYTSNCRPMITLEQPTITSLYPSQVAKNTSPTITITGEGFGPNQGSVSVAFSNLPAANITSWSPTSITFTWDSGNLPGTVTVQIYTKRAARSNGMTLTITN